MEVSYRGLQKCVTARRMRAVCLHYRFFVVTVKAIGIDDCGSFRAEPSAGVRSCTESPAAVNIVLPNVRATHRPAAQARSAFVGASPHAVRVPEESYR